MGRFFKVPRRDSPVEIFQLSALEKTTVLFTCDTSLADGHFLASQCAKPSADHVARIPVEAGSNAGVMKAFNSPGKEMFIVFVALPRI